MNKYIDADKLFALIDAKLEDLGMSGSVWTGRSVLNELKEDIKSLQQAPPEVDFGEDVMTMCNQILIDWVKEGKTQEEKEQREQAHIRFFELYDDYLMQEQPEVDLEKEIERWFDEGDITDTRFDDYDDTDIERTAHHFYELGLNARKSIWHNVAEEAPTKYGSEVIVACRNKNKEGGIWLYDLIQCWEGKWEPRVNWETPVKWAYLEDLDSSRKEE